VQKENNIYILSDLLFQRYKSVNLSITLKIFELSLENTCQIDVEKGRKLGKRILSNVQIRKLNDTKEETKRLSDGEGSS
jgi:hypothetical protein